MLRIQWNVNSWIDRKIVIIHKLIESYISSRKISKEEFIHEIKRFIDNINELSNYDFWKYLLKMNIVIEIDVRFNKLSTLPGEEWIGKYNAFQLPIYYWIFKTMYEERSIEITSNDILQIIKKSY